MKLGCFSAISATKIMLKSFMDIKFHREEALARRSARLFDLAMSTLGMQYLGSEQMKVFDFKANQVRLQDKLDQEITIKSLREMATSQLAL